MKVIIADKAKSDLFRIYSYVEQRSPLAAEKILARIDKKFDQLTWFPFIGRDGPASPPAFAVPSSEPT
jgi:plasmid stabilization system protein ParE